jgi:hypothetical protein
VLSEDYKYLEDKIKEIPVIWNWQNNKSMVT